MELFERYRLEKESDGYTVVLYLNKNVTEFSDELGHLKEERRESLYTTVTSYVKDKFPDIKVKTIKVVIGSMLFAVLPTAHHTVEAAEIPQGSLTSTAAASFGNYTVIPGDTLFGVANKTQVNVNDIRAFNNMASDNIYPNQVLKIPSTATTRINTYSVVSGDTLWSVSRKLNISMDVIKRANNMTTDNLSVGQLLLIPTPLTAVQSPSQTQPAPSTYTVASGDSLWSVARSFNTTVDALRTANNLTSDTLRIGQILVIPGAGIAAPSPTPTQPTTRTYTVTSGDSLWSIARNFNTTVDALRTANNLTSDTLRIGQVLTIPGTGTATITYTVASGDTLWSVARNNNTTVDALRSINNLTSDVLRVGQVLTIPSGGIITPAPAPAPSPSPSGEVTTVRPPNNMPPQLMGEATTFTYTTHRVASGENAWSIALRYGIPAPELLRVNNLTESSVLSIGQTLRIPVYNVPVQPTMGAQYGEYLDWWTQAQYLFSTNRVVRVIDMRTGRSFTVKRTTGAAHADCEPLTAADAAIIREIWGGGYSWSVRPVLVEIDGRRIAAAMSSMPHDVQYIKDNNFNGHFDIHFFNSLRHKDGLSDSHMQSAIRTAAGLQ
jgi:peptidoglycan DL-endopeptidase LytF